MKICRDCDYSVPIDGDPNGTLECRRHSIRAVGLDEDGFLVSAFPACDPTMWCGDWAYTPKLNVDLSILEP